MTEYDFILASASPRRKALLEQIGARFRCHPVDVDEVHRAGETPAQYVSRLALEKARAGLKPDSAVPVMGADTTVVCNGRVLGKPEDEAQGIEMLMALSATTHQVLTAVAMVSRDQCQLRLSVTDVSFCEISEPMCRAYWLTGEPADKAGGYGIQGLGAVFVDKIVGSYSGVVGLPLAQTRQLLELFGITYWHQNKR